MVGQVKVEWCDRTLFQCPIYYGLCMSEAEFKREMKRLDVGDAGPWITNEYSDATTHYFTRPDNKAYCAIVCIRVEPKRNGAEVVGLLVHEATHIWQEAKSRIGEQSPSREFEAYSIQWIAQQLVAAYVKKIKGWKPCRT